MMFLTEEEHTEVEERLRAHGLRYLPLKEEILDHFVLCHRRGNGKRDRF
jgi:hypothetical protein